LHDTPHAVEGSSRRVCEGLAVWTSPSSKAPPGSGVAPHHPQAREQATEASSNGKRDERPATACQGYQAGQPRRVLVGSEMGCWWAAIAVLAIPAQLLGLVGAAEGDASVMAVSLANDRVAGIVCRGSGRSARPAKGSPPGSNASAGLTCPGFGHVEGRSESRVDTGLVPGSAVEKTAAGPPRRNGTASPWTATRRAARSSDDTVDHVVAELRSERPLLVKEVDRHGDRQFVKMDADTSWALSEGSTSGAAWETAPPAPGRLRVQQPYFTA